MLNSTFTSEVVDFVVSSFTGNYTKFQTTLESKAGLQHYSPTPRTDPTFFLHHATIDRVWYTGTRATRMRSREAPLVGRIAPTCRTTSIPLELPLFLTRTPSSPAMACGRRLRLVMFWTQLAEGFVMFTNDSDSCVFCLKLSRFRMLYAGFSKQLCLWRIAVTKTAQGWPVAGSRPGYSI